MNNHQMLLQELRPKRGPPTPWVAPVPPNFVVPLIELLASQYKDAEEDFSYHPT